MQYSIIQLSNVQSDRPTTWVLGHAHFPWLLSSCVSASLECLECGRTHPLIGYMRPEVVLRMRELREAIPGNLGFLRMCRNAFASPPKEGVASLGTFCSKPDQNVIRITRLKHNGTYSYVFIRNSNQLNQNTILNKIYIKIISASSGMH